GDPAEYARREDIKNVFQTRYLDPANMVYDQEDLQTLMEQGQVGLEHLIDEVAQLYPHVAIIWNSCNFYTIVASRNPDNVKIFCSMFYPPYISEECAILKIDTPIKACGLERVELMFRKPDVSLLKVPAWTYLYHNLGSCCSPEGLRAR